MYEKLEQEREQQQVTTTRKKPITKWLQRKDGFQEAHVFLELPPSDKMQIQHIEGGRKALQRTYRPPAHNHTETVNGLMFIEHMHTVTQRFIILCIINHGLWAVWGSIS